MAKLTGLSSWKNLESHFQSFKNEHLRDLFAKDNQIATWEQEIETLQEEIEAFNAITKI